MVISPLPRACDAAEGLHHSLVRRASTPVADYGAGTGARARPTMEPRRRRRPALSAVGTALTALARLQIQVQRLDERRWLAPTQLLKIKPATGGDIGARIQGSQPKPCRLNHRTTDDGVQGGG